MEIKGIKSINNLKLELPVRKGLYAITGQNGTGKSTIIACAATLFFNFPKSEYFGKTDNGSFIKFEFGGATKDIVYEDNKWNYSQSENKMNIKGFYEGSIIYGNRFRDSTKFSSLKKLDSIDSKHLKLGEDFIRLNLGKILHNNESYYDKLYKINKHDSQKYYNFNGVPYYYEKNGKLVSQLHMSTGENLLINVLYSLYLRISDRNEFKTPCILLLDEIELALHPSSLVRLMSFLKTVSKDYNLAIYFSTHSIELIKDINPDNIYFLEKHADGSIEIINPCYPSYATRILYDHSGYDFVILVEDDLAKELIHKLLRKYGLLNSKLVHVLPCGGWGNVLKLAHETVTSNLIGRPSNVLVILDGDIKEDPDFKTKLNDFRVNIPLNYLPVESLEKYLKHNLVVNVDHVLFRKLNDYVFHHVSLTQIIDDYQNSDSIKNDKNGKKLFNEIDKELKNRGKNRSDLIGIIVNHLIEQNSSDTQKVITFLRDKLGDTSKL